MLQLKSDPEQHSILSGHHRTDAWGLKTSTFSCAIYEALEKHQNFSSAVPTFYMWFQIDKNLSLFVYREHCNFKPIENGEKQMNRNYERGFNLECTMDQ